MAESSGLCAAVESLIESFIPPSFGVARRRRFPPSHRRQTRVKRTTARLRYDRYDDLGPSDDRQIAVLNERNSVFLLPGPLSPRRSSVINKDVVSTRNQHKSPSRREENCYGVGARLSHLYLD